MYGGKDTYFYPYKITQVLKLIIINLIPRAQRLKTGSSYPALPL